MSPAIWGIAWPGGWTVQIEQLVDGYITLVRGFLDEHRCRELIEWSESRGYDEALLSDGSRRTEVRNNDRLIFDDLDLAATWWERIAVAVPTLPHATPYGLNERFRFYRYRPGQRFRHHIDGVFQRSADEFSQFTLMVYLNDDLQGGETTFTRLSVKPEVGTALLFHHQIEHAGSPVIAGVKYVLRTDVMFRRTRGDG